MGVHDWSRVDDGIFQDFHHAWIEEIKRALNGGLLPEWLYALAVQPGRRDLQNAEQHVSEFGPDVLALQAPDAGGRTVPEKGSDPLRQFENGSSFDLPPKGQTPFRAASESSDIGSSTGLLVAPPRVAMTLQGAEDFYTQRQKSVTIRHASDDRIVAIVEVVSPGNKSSQQRLDAFVRKACSLLRQGIHLLVLDLHLPTRRAPDGIHGAIWNIIGSSSDDDYHEPADKPLTLVGYQARLYAGVTAYVEPVVIGDSLREMPLYVTSEGYVSVPLQETYTRAFSAMPRRWARVLEQ